MVVLTIPGLQLRFPVKENGFEFLGLGSGNVDPIISEALSKKITAILTGEENPALSCDDGDGDQTPIGSPDPGLKVKLLLLPYMFIVYRSILSGYQEFCAVTSNA